MANRMLLKLIGAIVVIISQIPVECHAANSFEMKKVNCTFSASYFNLNESECTLKVEDGRNKLVGGHAFLKKAADDVKIAVQVYLGSKLLDGQYNLLFNISHNLCDIAEEANKTKLATVVRPLWEQYTNIPFGCPVEAGTYYVNDLDYDLLGQMIPVTILNGRYKIDIKAHHKNQFVMRISILMTVTTTATTARKHRNIH